MPNLSNTRKTEFHEARCVHRMRPLEGNRYLLVGGLNNSRTQKEFGGLVISRKTQKSPQRKTLSHSPSFG